MTDEDRKNLKEKIIGEIESLKANIPSLEESAKPVSPDRAIGRLTRMEAISAKGIHEASLSAARIKLSKLERALARINDPDFGICAQCEEPIPEGRIMIMPETTLCVRCAEK